MKTFLAKIELMKILSFRFKATANQNKDDVPTKAFSDLSAAAALNAGEECPGGQGPRPVHRLPIVIRAPRGRVDVYVLIIQADRPGLNKR